MFYYLNLESQIRRIAKNLGFINRFNSFNSIQTLKLHSPESYKSPITIY